MQKSAALGKTPPSSAKWGLQGHSSLASAVHLLHKKVSTCLTPLHDLQQQLQTYWAVGKSGFCPALLILHRTRCTHTGRHMPTPQQRPRSHSVLLDVGWPVEPIVQPLCLGGCRQEALALSGDGDVSLLSSLSLLVLCLEPNPPLFQCFWAATLWSMQKSHDALGREGWCNGVQAADRKYCALVQEKLFPHREKVERQQLFWRRSICGPGKYKICWAVHGILAGASSAC